MPSYPNIESKPKATGHYIGYALGTWDIRKYSKGSITWRVTHRERQVILYGATLAEVSSKLDGYEATHKAEHTKELRRKHGLKA